MLPGTRTPRCSNLVLDHGVFAAYSRSRERIVGRSPEQKSTCACDAEHPDVVHQPSLAAIMCRHHIRHLPVPDENGDFEGMLGLRYLLYEVLDDLERKVGDLTTWLLDDSLGD